MVAAVANFIRGVGVNNTVYPIIESPLKTSRKFTNIFTHTPKPTGTVTISLDNDHAALRQAWHYRYRVAAHEFGHALGLPDEYMDSYHGIGTQAHDNWRQLCNQAGVPFRPVPKFDASIMSCGWQTYPCHYVTLWHALGQLTL